MHQNFIGKYIRIKDLDIRTQNKIKRIWGTRFGENQPVALLCAFKEGDDVAVGYSSCRISELDKFSKSEAWDIAREEPLDDAKVPFHIRPFIEDITVRAKAFFNVKGVENWCRF